ERTVEGTGGRAGRCTGVIVSFLQSRKRIATASHRRHSLPALRFRSGSANVDYFAIRRERLAALFGADLDALAISNPVNVTYLTGFSGDSSWLIVLPKRALLVSDGRYTVQIADECPGLETVIRPPHKNIYQAVAETISALGVRNVGF